MMWGILVLSSSAFVALIKYLTSNTSYKCLMRPEGAKNCGAWNDGGEQGGQPGFPSGHVATAATFWTVATILTGDWIVGILGCIMVAAMAWARLQKKCHTVVQVIGGGIVGGVIGLLGVGPVAPVIFVRDA